jgi:hypothetical protein
MTRQMLEASITAEGQLLIRLFRTYMCVSFGLHPVPYTPYTAFTERMAS